MMINEAEFLGQLVQKVTRVTGCVGITCVVDADRRTLRISSENGVCNIHLSRHGCMIYEIYGRMSQGGINLMDRLQIKELLVDSDQLQ